MRRLQLRVAEHLRKRRMLRGAHASTYQPSAVSVPFGSRCAAFSARYCTWVSRARFVPFAAFVVFTFTGSFEARSVACCAFVRNALPCVPFG